MGGIKSTGAYALSAQFVLEFRAREDAAPATLGVLPILFGRCLAAKRTVSEYSAEPGMHLGREIGGNTNVLDKFGAETG